MLLLLLLLRLLLGFEDAGQVAAQQGEGHVQGRELFLPGARGQAGGQSAGECYNRCRLFCVGDAAWCDWVCSFICEHAPVTQGVAPPRMFLRS